MSSILKALKKLESESAHINSVQPWPAAAKAGLNRQGALRSVAAFIKKAVLPAIFLSVILALFAFVWHLLDRPSEISTASGSNPPEKVGKTEAKAAKNAPPILSVPPDTAIPMTASPDKAVPTDSIAEDKKSRKGGSVAGMHQLDGAVGKKKDRKQLSLQAIAWSPIPEKRIAVINDRIVKEGNIVDGIIIVSIQDDQVVVRKGDRAWEITFQHH